jgi:carboxylesterase
MVHEKELIKSHFLSIDMRKAGIIALVIIGIILILGTLIFLGIRLKTGAFHPNQIDLIDEKKWNFTSGIINGAEEIRYYGSNKTCWLMIHGYGSTPKDFFTLLPVVRSNFNETIIAPRLLGHGELPSKTLNYSFSDWYSQVEKEFLILNDSCSQVNLVGFSFGGALSLRIAENYPINNIYLISPFLKIRYKAYHIFPKEKYISFAADRVVYSVKYDIAQLNSPEGKKGYISYYSFPLISLKNSFKEIAQVTDNLGFVKAKGMLIMQSKNDDTIDVESSKIINRSVTVENRELIIYDKSNHVLLMDYDKDDAIKRVIEFEEGSRE